MTDPGERPGGLTATAGATVAAWLRCSAAAVHERRSWLTELDAAIGDGDHGINLDRGFAAIIADLDTGTLPTDDAATLIVTAGRRLLGVVGGASGALYGRGLITAGERLRAYDGPRTLDTRGRATLAIAGAVDGITALGRAAPGDKTMLDALLPALAALRDAPASMPISVVLARMAEAAEAGAASTVPLVARKGRASYLGERSAGNLDPGAASSAILVRCLADVVGTGRRGIEADPPPGSS